MSNGLPPTTGFRSFPYLAMRLELAGVTLELQFMPHQLQDLVAKPRQHWRWWLPSLYQYWPEYSRKVASVQQARSRLRPGRESQGQGAKPALQAGQPPRAPGDSRTAFLLQAPLEATLNERQELLLASLR